MSSQSKLSSLSAAEDTIKKAQDKSGVIINKDAETAPRKDKDTAQKKSDMPAEE